MTNVPIIHHLPSNDMGRDFVVGDLHGARASLDAALARINFNPSWDRLFCVGDLVNRGPDPWSCLALLAEPWFYCVRGNHEEMLLDWLDAPDTRTRRHAATALLENGARTWARSFLNDPAYLSHDTQQTFEQVGTLPHLLVVGSGRQRFHVVHAELHEQSAAEGVQTDAAIDAGLADAEPRTLIWSRIIMAPGNNHLPETATGLSSSYCGHTVDRGIRKRLSHICLDTGAWIAEEENDPDHGLTVVEAHDNRPL